MPVYFDREKRRYRFEFDCKIGERRHRATKLLPKAWTKEEADKWARQEEARLYALASGQVKEEITISGAVKLYLEEHVETLKSKNDYIREFDNLLPLYSGMLVSQLPEVADKIRKLKVSAATKKNKISYLRAACRYAFKKGLCEHNPSDRLVIPRVNNARHVYPERKQVVQAARKNKNKVIRAAILTAFYSGMRISEIKKADISNGVFWLKTTKNREPRAIPMHPKLFVYRRHIPCKYTRSWVSRKFKEAIGDIDMRFHDLRHGSASEMINAGVPLSVVGEVLGHKDYKSTKRYAHLVLDTLNDAVKRIGTRNKK